MSTKEEPMTTHEQASALLQTTRDRILQAQVDALCGKTIHARRLSRLRTLSAVIDILVIVVPVLFFAPRLLANSPHIQGAVDIVNVILSVSLLALGIVKQIGRWEDKVRTHSKYLSENIVIKNEADRLLRQPTTTEHDGGAFLRLVEAVEKPDSEVLADVKPTEKQFAYREALKELVPESPRCPQCDANPWMYKAGPCQMCGGTPLNGGANAGSG